MGIIGNILLRISSAGTYDQYCDELKHRGSSYERKKV